MEENLKIEMFPTRVKQKKPFILAISRSKELQAKDCVFSEC